MYVLVVGGFGELSANGPLAVAGLSFGPWVCCHPPWSRPVPQFMEALEVLPAGAQDVFLLQTVVGGWLACLPCVHCFWWHIFGRHHPQQGKSAQGPVRTRVHVHRCAPRPGVWRIQPCSAEALEAHAEVRHRSRASSSFASQRAPPAGALHAGSGGVVVQLEHILPNFIYFAHRRAMRPTPGCTLPLRTCDLNFLTRPITLCVSRAREPPPLKMHRTRRHVDGVYESRGDREHRAVEAAVTW